MAAGDKAVNGVRRQMLQAELATEVSRDLIQEPLKLKRSRRDPGIFIDPQ